MVSIYHRYLLIRWETHLNGMKRLQLKMLGKEIENQIQRYEYKYKYELEIYNSINNNPWLIELYNTDDMSLTSLQDEFNVDHLDIDNIIFLVMTMITRIIIQVIILLQSLLFGLLLWEPFDDREG